MGTKCIKRSVYVLPPKLHHIFLPKKKTPASVQTPSGSYSFDWKMYNLTRQKAGDTAEGRKGGDQ